MKDPVCGMDVDDDESEKYVHEGKTYYFCCSGCMNVFKKNPAKYV